MQRTRWAVGCAAVLGLWLGLSAPAQAQVYYVQSSNIQSLPVTQSVVTTRAFVGSRYGSYGSFGRAQTWNSRRSAPAVYHENRYLPEATTFAPIASSSAIVAAQPCESSSIISSRAGMIPQAQVYSDAVTYSQPIVTSRSVRASQPVIYSNPVVVSQPIVSSSTVLPAEPVRVYRSVVSSPQVVREVVESQSARQDVQPVVTTQTIDGRRVKTYRYEYDISERPGRTKVTFEFGE